MKIIALRIDVDTLRGTRQGVPVLNSIMDEFKVKGTYYFSVGPDNMGRHLWRLLKPRFLWKMLRTNAGGLYGYDIVFMGTAWPGPNIGRGGADAIRAAAGLGHEIGFHAWDHYSSQAKIDVWSAENVRRELERGSRALENIAGGFPATSATPGWRCNEEVLLEKAKLPFVYNSDCRGVSPFYPVVGGRRLDQLQIPVTLPTYDEALGRNGVTDENYNDYMFSLLSEDRPNVLTVHAEAEGGKCSGMFREFLKRCQGHGWKVFTLGELADEYAGKAPDGRVVPKAFPGREGWLACQE